MVSGFIGGHTLNPTYKDICNGDTGHAEAIQISFDPSVVSFSTLLEIFFISHDPTTPNRQGNDIGTQYRSSIFCQNAEQLQTVEAYIDALNRDDVFGAPVVTEINGAETFYPAEDYHQQFFAKNPYQPYCMAVAAPKVMKIRAKYASLLKA